MPIPTHEDGSPGPTKHLVVFVHGFASDGSCWDDLLKLMGADPRFSDYEFKRFEYPTQLMRVSFSRRLLSPRNLGRAYLQRMPSLSELGRSLRAFLDPFFGESSGESFIDITLIGHSMGGLVIQSFIVDHLDENLGSELRQIRQVMMLATPNLGSNAVSWLRRVLYFFLPNVQETALQVLNPEINSTLGKIQKRVIDAQERRGNECPIPFHAFWGLSDRVVPEASARGPFPTSTPLEGDHFGVIRPASQSDPSYQQISEAILHPVGHSHVFEVDEFLFSVKAIPTPDGFQYVARHGSHTRSVQTDNKALITRQATIAKTNRCAEGFTIKYATLNEGFIQPFFSHENDAPNDLKRMWEDEGTHVWFQFHPEPRGKYSLNMEVYKGFDDGNRNVHHHLQKNSFFRRYVFVLDLTEYLARSFSIKVEPTLCFLRQDPEHSALCVERARHHAEPPVSSANGIWRWELEYLREGVIDVRWDVGAAKHATT